MKINNIEQSTHFGWKPNTHSEITKLALTKSKRFRFSEEEINYFSKAVQNAKSVGKNDKENFESYSMFYQTALMDNKKFLEYTGKALHLLQETTSPKKKSLFAKITQQKRKIALPNLISNYKESNKCPTNLMELYRFLVLNANNTKSTQERFNITVDATRMFIEKMFAVKDTFTP